MIVRHIVLAMAASVAITPLSGIAWEVGNGLLSGHPVGLRFALTSGSVLGLVANVFIVPVLLLIGIPAFLALRHFGLASLATCLAVAALISIVAAGVDRSASKALAESPQFLCFALPTSLAFWYFARHAVTRPVDSELKVRRVA